MLLAALLGTYLDLLFVGRSLYHFPNRPFEGVFSINILFTLLILPVSMMNFLLIMELRNLWWKCSILILCSLSLSVLEKKAEELGFFVHSNHWSHMNTFIGAFIYFLLIYRFHHWVNNLEA